MKRFINVVVAISSLFSSASGQYWQQDVSYNIDVSLNDKNHSLKGFLKLEYTNHSPDKLDYIWFHLWPNAFKNENTAYFKQILHEKDGIKKWSLLKDKGSMDSLDFAVNGKRVKTEPDPENIDIIKVVLPQPLQPGGTITITTPFAVKLPTYISRSGHLDQSYMICQWYPKPAVYDQKGWHPMPYLESGEFYSEFGKYTVNITAPSAYVIGATGTMKNEDELIRYKETGRNNQGPRNKKYIFKGTAPVKTISYQAENVHDFAWFADKDFIIEYDTIQLASGKVIDAFSYHHGTVVWDSSIDYIKDAVRHYSSWVGEYPYPVVQAVEGPKNSSSGGMEYPMITLITEPEADNRTIDGTITHEVGHNWFCEVLGSNERDHAWMDEGINTYYQLRYEHEKYRADSFLGDLIPENVKQAPLDQFEVIVYNALNTLPMESPIDQTATAYLDDEEYGKSVYIKAAIWMFAIETFEGREKFDKAMKEYFEAWKFKHPYPEDLKMSLEKSFGKSVDAYFALLKQKGNLK